MEKSLIIGIDLSFNSTGITISYLEDNIGKEMAFSRLVFDKKPNPIINIDQQTYTLPHNVSVDDLIVAESDDFYSEDQAGITLKAMICTKRIMKIIIKAVEKYNPNSVYFNIEGFIMPSLTGVHQLRIIGGLIMLQGMLRADLIKLKISKPNIETYKIYITSPSELKLFFTGNGGLADKQLMLDAFLQDFDGAKLLPDTESLAKVNDVIDSFALMLNVFYRLNTSSKRKLSKTQQKRENKYAESKANKKKKQSKIIII